MDLPSPVRVVAALTVAYSVAITVAPKVLAGPCQMLDAQGEVPPQIETLVRSTGVRDAALAAVLLVSHPGPASRTLIGARVVSDAADALWFGLLPIPADAKAKVAGAAAGWATIEALAWWADRSR
ncbi:MAG: hypothetical protein ACR2KG_09380 [Nocardioidaceae bacterium]